MSNKTALITGGSKGIGYGVAEAMLEQGINVVVTSRSTKNAENAAKELSKISNDAKVMGLCADVRSFEDQKSVVSRCVAEFGGLDYLIANAGVGNFGSIEDLTSEQWKETIDINLTGVFYSIKSSLEELKKSKGYIITISSLAGTNFFAGGAAYNASKFGLTGFTQAVMLDLRNHGIKVSTIMPGSVATYFNNHVPDEKDSWKIQKEDIGKIVIDLINMHPRTLPSKIEVRPTTPPKK